jgi:hypothetical protein
VREADPDPVALVNYRLEPVGDFKKEIVLRDLVFQARYRRFAGFKNTNRTVTELYQGDSEVCTADINSNGRIVLAALRLPTDTTVSSGA